MSLPRVSLFSTYLLLALFLAACNSKPTAPTGAISASNYDKSCASVADCVPVFEEIANCCDIGCPNTALSVSGFASFNEALQAAQLASCSGPMVCHGGTVPSNCIGRVDCRDGACLFLGAPRDGSAE